MGAPARPWIRRLVLVGLAVLAVGFGIQRLGGRRHGATPQTRSVPHDGGQAPSSSVEPPADSGGATPAAARGRDATLTVQVRDAHGASLPARLTFVGVDGTPAPTFTATDIGLAQPGAAGTAAILDGCHCAARWLAD